MENILIWFLYDKINEKERSLYVFENINKANHNLTIFITQLGNYNI